MSRSKVSIITPTFNGERFIKQTIRSVLAQSFTSFEMVIVDDGSTDDTQKIVSAFSDNRIRYVRYDHRGCVAAYNACIELAKGQFIAVLDHDDCMMPDRLAEQVKFLDQRQDIGLVGSFFVMTDEQNEFLREVRVPQGYDRIRKVEAVHNAIFHPTVLVRKIIFEKMGGYREEFFPAHDTEFLLRAVNQFKTDNIPKYLTKYRRVRSSPTQRLGTKQEEIHYSVRKHYNLSRFQATTDRVTKREYAGNLGEIAYWSGDGREARRWFLQSFKLGAINATLVFYLISSSLFYPIIILLKTYKVREKTIFFLRDIKGFFKTLFLLNLTR